MFPSKSCALRTSVFLASVVLSSIFPFLVECQVHTETNKLQLINQTIERLRCFREFNHTTDHLNETSAEKDEADESNETRAKRLKNVTFHDISSLSSQRHQRIINCDSQRIILVKPTEFYDAYTASKSDSFTVRNETFLKDAFCLEKFDDKGILIKICHNDTVNAPSAITSDNIISGSTIRTLKFTEQTNNKQNVGTENELPQVKSLLPKKQVALFRKCCKENEKIEYDLKLKESNKNFKCVPNKDEPVWDPALFPTVESNFNEHVHMESGGEIHIHPKYLFGLPECSDSIHHLSNDQDTWFKVLEDGLVKVGLKFWFRPVWLLVDDHDSPNYCIDEVTKSMLQEETHINFSLPFNSHNPEVLHRNQILLYCKIHRFDEYLFHRNLFGTLCVLASAIIGVILGIYLSVWDKQNLAGWTQFSIFFALFFVFLMEGTRTLVDSNALLIKVTTSCRIIALIAQIFFFAVNTSWSVMCWDLFWTFWKLESTDKPLKEHPKRVAAYIFFSWVLPVIVVIIAFYYSDTKAHDDRERMDGIYQDGHRRCSSPIRDFGFKTQGIMFLINALFFIFTAFLIWRHRRGINANRRVSKSQRNNWRSAKLFGKLLIVMGVASLSVPIDYFFGSEDPLSFFAVMLRSVHFIPVVSILFIFGFNEKNIRLMTQKYPRIAKMGCPCCPTKAITTDTNPSPSGQGQQITTIPA